MGNRPGSRSHRIVGSAKNLDDIRLDQIRTIDRCRVIKRLGAIDADTVRKVDEVIKISLGLIKI